MNSRTRMKERMIHTQYEKINLIIVNETELSEQTG
jgi:hypothetical protein